MTCFLQSTAALGQGTGLVSIDIVDQDSGDPLVCRVQLRTSTGIAIRARGSLGFVQGWNLISSPFEYKGRAGDYSYQAFHGPEYAAGSGGFTIDRKSNGTDWLELPRHADLESEGWRGGDLLSYIEANQLQPWLAAEGLTMAAAVSVEGNPETARAIFDSSTVEPWVEQGSYLDHRAASGLVMHHWMPPATVPGGLPSTRLLVMAKSVPAGEIAQDQLPVVAEIQTPWARDVPIWLASGKIDLVQVLGEHLTIDGTRAREVEALVAPEGTFRGDRGPGRLVEQIYWQMLEAGFRLAPSAGSGFGKSPSPLGYNRVYGFVNDSSPKHWWQAIQEGRSFVTNGPLLRALINGQPPGSTLVSPDGTSVKLSIQVDLTTADPVDYLDIIHNGQTIYQATLDEFAQQGGKIPLLELKESGWVLARVITGRDFSYRFATTAPFFVEVTQTPRISRKSVRFFQDWLEKASEQINKLTEPERAAHQPYVDAARAFWAQRMVQATVE